MTMQRPTFYEGQIVSAADLAALVDHPRTALAQHERHLHLPGIATGLKLVGTQRTTQGGTAYQEVVVEPGLAIDGNGRHIVVAETERLSEDSFDSDNVAVSDAQAWYPVFLSGRDQAVAASGGTATGCQGSAPTRVSELATIGFGRIDEGTDPHNEIGAGLANGPDAAGSPWRVLLGFVKWDSANKRFAAVADNAGGVDRSYVGVRADAVVAQGSSLSLHSADPTESGKPAVEIDAAAGGELRFGLQNSSGKVVPVFSVNASGDLFAAGKISGAVAGGAQFQTGSAFDGMLLPLPPGITAAQVAAGDVRVQAHVTPHYGVPALATLASPHRWLMTPIECRVDADRRVLCRNRWLRTDTNAIVELPGLCDFSLTALVAA